MAPIENPLFDLFHRNERLSMWVQHFIASLMLACVVVSIVQLGEFLLPSWDGGYLVPVSFLIALEAMVTRRIVSEYDVLSREWLLYRATEWIVILLVLKGLLYTIRGFGQFFQDLPRLGQDFINTFFTNEYTFLISIAFMVWLLAGVIASELAKLEGDERLLRLERESGLYLQRPAVRRNLGNLMLSIGGVMAASAAFIYLDRQGSGMELPSITGELLNLLAYFILGLILLSLTQFSILRAHWSLERIPISPDLAARWVIYSLFFLIGLALLSTILPTRYSLGLLEILGYLFALVISVLQFILFIVSLPLLFLFGLLSMLFGQSEVQEQVQMPEFVLPPPPPGSEGSPWLEVLKSLLFWLFFLGVIGFSLHYYLQQHKELLEQFRRVPFILKIARALGWVKGWLRGVNREIVAAVGAGLRRFRGRRPGGAVGQSWRYINPRRFSPRQRVLYYYLAMIRRGGEKGVARAPAQTPYEYSRTLSSHVDEAQEEITSLTDQFMEARYSEHEITNQKASLVQQYWRRIQRALRSAFKSPESASVRPDKKES